MLQILAGCYFILVVVVEKGLRLCNGTDGIASRGMGVSEESECVFIFLFS